jgi:toxin ParE1/3/4
MPLDIRKTPAAENDLIEIWSHTFESWGEDQADNYLDEIDLALRRVADHPEIGADSSEIRSGYRRIAAGRHRIFYRIRAEAVEVIRVLHVSMDASRHLDD